MAPKVWIGTEAAQQAVIPAGEDHVVGAERTSGNTSDVIEANSFEPLEGARVATISLAEGADLIGALTEVERVVRGILQPCQVCNGTGVDDTEEPGCQNCAGSRVQSVVWVASDDPALEALLARQYGAEAGVPSDVEDTYYTENGPPGENTGVMTVGPNTDDTTGLIGGFTSNTGPTDPQHHFDIARRFTDGLDLDCHEHFRRWTDHDGIAYLRVAAGRDFQSRVMGDTASNATGSYAAANYIALTENATAPADGDTALAGELTDSGLTRAQATYAHVAGSSTYTLTKTFTSGTATARTIQKVGVLNAAAAGTLVFESALTNPPTLQQNDQLTVTVTVTI